MGGGGEQGPEAVHLPRLGPVRPAGEVPQASRGERAHGHVRLGGGQEQKPGAQLLPQLAPPGRLRVCGAKEGRGDAEAKGRLRQGSGCQGRGVRSQAPRDREPAQGPHQLSGGGHGQLGQGQVQGNAAALLEALVSVGQGAGPKVAAPRGHSAAAAALGGGRCPGPPPWSLAALAERSPSEQVGFAGAEGDRPAGTTAREATGGREEEILGSGAAARHERRRAEGCGPEAGAVRGRALGGRRQEGHPQGRDPSLEQLHPREQAQGSAAAGSACGADQVLRGGGAREPEAGAAELARHGQGRAHGAPARADAVQLGRQVGQVPQGDGGRPRGGTGQGLRLRGVRQDAGAPRHADGAQEVDGGRCCRHSCADVPGLEGVRPEQAAGGRAAAKRQGLGAQIHRERSAWRHAFLLFELDQLRALRGEASAPAG
mmetsp:Transcript_82395/g.197678  ORF Transcript_82395/g.197678 Transcript_82395/m.197678 type:complete len:429 (-) Transcript_82395:305-1591(-)